MQDEKKNAHTPGFIDKLLQLTDKFDLFLGRKTKSGTDKRIKIDKSQYENKGNAMEQDTSYMELVDEDVLTQMIADTSADVIPMLIDHYLEESEQRMSRIDDAVNTQDKDALEFEVHTLGSTALALGNRLLSNLARKIEHLCLNEKEQEAFELYPELKQLAARSFQAIEQRKNVGFTEPS